MSEVAIAIGIMTGLGLVFGAALAITISWTANKSLLWVLIHGCLSWLYVIYYAIRYHF